MERRKKMTSCNLQKIFEQRRSIYNLGKVPETQINRITPLVEQCLMHCPSAFNSQSARICILYGEDYQLFWKTVRQKLLPLTSPDKVAAMEEKNRAFAAGSGTILFFEDQAVVKKLQQDFPLYKDNFPIWSLQSNGMLQYMVWLALSEQGIGASLQHYNPLVDDDVQKIWNISPEWKLLAQMPFGSIAENPGEKSFLPLEERIKVFGIPEISSLS